jgi:nucleotide-binding universal stress UspA family protein
MEKEILIVPIDFTDITINALEHACNLAPEMNAEICLLHIVEKEGNKLKAEAALEGLALKYQSSQAPIKYLIRSGSIFEEIGETATELDAMMIIMGTHGLRGWQFLTGSNALKVIRNSSVPFIVVQERGPRQGINHMVLPIDLAHEEKQKLASAAELAKLFDTTVHIISPKQDDEFLANQQKRNMRFAEEFLAQKGVRFDSVVTDESGSFEREVMRHAARWDADLICILNHEDSGSALFGSSFEQHIITNEAQIPVLVVNQKITTRIGGVIGT